MLKKSFAISGALISLMLLSGCGAGGTCAGWSAIYIRKADNFTDATAKEILKHDEYGHSLGCAGFKPK
jgi:hypothetical protein